MRGRLIRAEATPAEPCETVVRRLVFTKSVTGTGVPGAGGLWGSRLGCEAGDLSGRARKWAGGGGAGLRETAVA